MKKFNLAVVGATGMVGTKFLEVLTERNLPVENYYLYASSKSAGKEIDFMGKKHTVIELKEENIKDKKIDLALFSAGASVSKEYTPIFVKNGAVVVDNSSCWRTDPTVPLVVPEVNPEDIDWHNGIIANPNCSTIQAVVAIAPLYKKYGIKRIVYSTYQAVSGAGVQAYEDLKEGASGVAPKKFPYPIFANLIPQIDVFMEDRYTKEEEKMRFETKKIFHDQSIKVTATTVRVPVFFGHSESINLEFKKAADVEGMLECLRAAPGIVVQDDPKTLTYPMPLYAENKDEVFVGRVRVDDTVEYGANIFVVADNIRKGAATNTIQIAELLINKWSK